MKAYIAILLLGLIPLCTSLNCYLCVSGAGGCNDPFNTTGSGVTTMDSATNTYCMKAKVGGIVARSGASACAAVSVNENTVTACCQTNLCNGAHGQYQTPILLALSAFVILIKFKKN